MNNKQEISNSFFSNVAKYLDGSNFWDVYFNNNDIKYSKLVRRLNKYIPVSENESIETVFNHLYNFLSANYRNDVIYKIEFLDAIEQFIDDVNDSFIVNEFKFGRNRVDLAVFNGKSIAFEIKSDIDRADNLKEQFEQYPQIFDYCYLITNKEKIDKFVNLIPENTGIILLDGKFNFSLHRKAKLNEELSYAQLFRILRKDEYLDMMEIFFQNIPSVPNTRIFKECSTRLSEVEFEKFKHEFLNKIKSRGYSANVSELIQFEKTLRQGYLANIKIVES